jgi:hypothetical protein
MIAAISLLFSILSVFLVPSSPVFAATAFDRCGSGAKPDIDVPFTQYGNVGSVNYPAGPNPDNGIFPGDAVRIAINWNSVVYVDYWGHYYNVDGKGEAATSGFPFPGWSKYGDFFRWNNKPGGWIGIGGSNPYNPIPLSSWGNCHWAPSLPARFIAQINDDNLGDNQGAWVYHLQIWCGPNRPNGCQ